MRTRVLFVCYGNICRSPIAEFVFRDMVAKAGLSDSIETASCATSADHLGDKVDPRSAKVMAKHGISCEGKRARRITRADFGTYDYIIGMDRRNLEYIRTLAPSPDCCRMGMLMEYAGGGEVADPWYTGDFDRAYNDIERGCKGLLQSIIAERGCGR
ncbi:MAG: low molecular weight protein-tyrosine-phosphatase [Candidatus Methanomethylophilaceae archaeon]|nr:low molecular weight protein-tyrosine-phosphatase [Candidatus Methanomethylophilaceae archaeon]